MTKCERRALNDKLDVLIFGIPLNTATPLFSLVTVAVEAYTPGCEYNGDARVLRMTITAVTTHLSKTLSMEGRRLAKMRALL